MKNITSVVGWLLLAAVLAVPSFLFYNWWAKNKQQVSSEMTKDPVAANVFPPAEKPATAPQRIAARPAAAPVQVPARVPVQSSTQAAVPAVVQDAVQPSATAQPPVPVERAPVATSSAPAAVAGQAKPVSYYSPKSDRDPTLSPDDYTRLKQVEQQGLEMEHKLLLQAARKSKETPFESSLKLQGIVGKTAIINGEMYYEGQMIKIYGAKVSKVGVNYIILEYKGKKFRKAM